MLRKAKLDAELNEDFRPPDWLRNPHVMTICTAFIARGKGLEAQPVEKTTIRVSEDSALLAYCHMQPGDEPDRPTLILVHGLEGSSESGNILGLAQNAYKAGANVIRLNLRNCGDSLHLTPTLYNAGLSSDLLAVLDWLVETKQLRNLVLVGFSLGGNLILKAACELGSRAKVVSAACVISPAIDLDACVRRMETGLGRLYEFNFLRRLRSKLIQKQKLFPDRYDLSRLSQATTIRRFDDLYTAPDGGYRDAAEYYERASSSRVMNRIALPTLIITAQDDPIVPFSLFSEIETDYVRLLAPKYGGHGGFLSNARAGLLGALDQDWVDRQILRFCLAHSKNSNDEVDSL